MDTKTSINAAQSGFAQRLFSSCENNDDEHESYMGLIQA